jgi:hypothetical protein
VRSGGTGHAGFGDSLAAWRPCVTCASPSDKWGRTSSIPKISESPFASRSFSAAGPFRARGRSSRVLAGRLLARTFPAVPPADALGLGIAIHALGSVIVLASLLPAWRASRADPPVVLRLE